MSLASLSNIYLPAIEGELHHVVDGAFTPETQELRGMLAYHLGWEGAGAGPEAQGKRIRPLLVLLVASATAGQSGATPIPAWQRALPAAASVELLHNFSLIHDDIQDHSPLRRGRPTVWMNWGIAQAINAGDSMFSLAQLAMLDLVAGLPAEPALAAARLLNQTCLALTQGQYLDISYETRLDLTPDAYWPMITGKTAALLTACASLGALIGGASDPVQQAFHDFGHHLGLAFQAQDDYLGIWGDSSQVGKSTSSDLETGKKSLPVLFGLAQNGAFAARWRQGPIRPDQAEAVALLLERDGAKSYTQKTVDELTHKALSALQAAQPQPGEAGQALAELANLLLKRQS